MRASSSLMLLLLTSGSLLAQANTANTQATLPPPLFSQGCPVSFYANRTGGLVAHYAKDGHQDTDGQGLQLTFGRHDAPQIAKTIVTVHGFSPQPGIMPVGSKTKATISETFILERHPGAASLDRSEIQTHKMGPVSWLELTQIEYADGSTWQKSKESKCITQPSPFLLVKATASR